MVPKPGDNEMNDTFVLQTECRSEFAKPNDSLDSTASWRYFVSTSTATSPIAAGPTSG